MGQWLSVSSLEFVMPFDGTLPIADIMKIANFMKIVNVVQSLRTHKHNSVLS